MQANKSSEPEKKMVGWEDTGEKGCSPISLSYIGLINITVHCVRDLQFGIVRCSSLQISSV